MSNSRIRMKFLSKSKIEDSFLEEVISQLESNSSRMKGELNSETILKVRNAVKNSRKLSPIHRTMILEVLKYY